LISSLKPFSAWKDRRISAIKKSIIEQTYCSENLPQPFFAKEGKFLPFVKGGE